MRMVLQETELRGTTKQHPEASHPEASHPEASHPEASHQLFGIHLLTAR